MGTVGIKAGQLLVETRLPIRVGSVVRAVGFISAKSGSREVEGRLLVAKCVFRSGVFQIALAFKEVRCGNLSSNHPMKVLDQSSPGSCARTGTDTEAPGNGMNEAETRTAGVIMLRVCGVRQ